MCARASGTFPPDGIFSSTGKGIVFFVCLFLSFKKKHFIHLDKKICKRNIIARRHKSDNRPTSCTDRFDSSKTGIVEYVQLRHLTKITGSIFVGSILMFIFERRDEQR